MLATLLTDVVRLVKDQHGVLQGDAHGGAHNGVQEVGVRAEDQLSFACATITNLVACTLMITALLGIHA